MELNEFKWVLIPSENKDAIISKRINSNFLEFTDSIDILNEYEPYDIYIVNDSTVEVGYWGIGYQIGFRGHGACHYLFFNDGTIGSKINAVCRGAMRVLFTTNKEVGCPPLSKDLISSILFNYNKEPNICGILNKK